MQSALLAAAGGLPEFELIVEDVDASPNWLARYDELVPVLLAADGVEICHYHLDLAKVGEYLGRFK